MKASKPNILFLLLFIVLTFIRCVDDINEDILIDEPSFEPVEIIRVTMYGTVTDQQGIPISNAELTIVNSNGLNSTTYTDDNGYYEYFDVQVKGNVAIMSISAEDKFDLEQQLSVVNEKIFNANFKLATFEKLGEFTASGGGQIAKDNVVELNFDGNTIIDSEGHLYNGQVEVYVNAIDPFEKEANERSVGGNLGEDQDYKKVVKYSYQSLQVELISPQGEILNIKTDATVKVKIPIQDNLPGGSINKELTLMSYDENEHLWKEETTGMAENGYYTADIPHFSTWTWCDILSNPVNISGTVSLLDQGIPYNGKSYVLVDYGIISFLEPTSIDGSFLITYGLSETPFTLYIWNECEEEIYTENYNALMNNTDLGTFEIETPPNYTNQLTATVYNCDSTLVLNGYSRFCINELDYTRCQIIPIVDGQVSYDFLDCDTELTGNLFLLNEENLLTTAPIAVNLNENDVNIDYVTLCDTFKNNITVNVNGSLFYSYHRISYGGISGPPHNHIVLSDNEFGGVSISIEGPFNNPGSYNFRYFFLENADKSVYSKDWNASNVIFELEEFEPNASNPNNLYLTPEHLKGTFSGEITQIDFITGEEIGTLLIDGSVLID